MNKAEGTDGTEEREKLFKPGDLNLANLLTLSRILVSPLFVYLLRDYRRNRKYLAAMLFAAAGLTDYLDGQVARKRGMVTRLGQFLDPLADKVYISTPLIMLAWLGRVKRWVPAVIIGREAVITGFRIYANRQGVSVPATRIAKLKTNAQILAIVLLMLDFRINDSDRHQDAAVWLAVFLTVYSGINYIVNIERYLGRREKGAA
jgi:CDP-diacylglycerol--glycerol-3-phosphate 3-phosphatidyltransferase